MAHIDQSGHLHLDTPNLVLCPKTGHVENVIVHPGDTAPSEPICEGCYEVFNTEERDHGN